MIMVVEMLTDIAHIVIPILIIIASAFAVVFKDLIAAAIAIAAMSLLLSLEFYILQAPDVAIAEAGIGACLTTAILVISIRATRREEEV
jgi:energy-converting hydrogenase B subunit D